MFVCSRLGKTISSVSCGVGFSVLLSWIFIVVKLTWIVSCQFFYRLCRSFYNAGKDEICWPMGVIGLSSGWLVKCLKFTKCHLLQAGEDECWPWGIVALSSSWLVNFFKVCQMLSVAGWERWDLLTMGRCCNVVKLTDELFKVCQMPCVAGRVPGWGRRDLSVGHGALLHGGLQQHAADQWGHRHRPPCAEEAQPSGRKLAAGRGYLYSSGSGVGGYWGHVCASAVAGTRFM